MADRNVAARTFDALSIAVSAVAIDRCGDGFVAMAARTFHDLVIKFSDLDGVWIFAGGEIEGVPESVIRLDRVFSDDVMRSVTVVAGCGVVMARLDPSIVLLAHDVTVDAGGGIVRQVRVSFGIDERISTDANDEAERDRED
jgi:hypothetical protein